MDTVLIPGAAEIHASDIHAFRACRRQWSWTSRLGDFLEPKAIYAPFFFGSIVHYCLERLYGFDEPIDVSLPVVVDEKLAVARTMGSLWDFQQAAINEQITLAEDLLYHYVAWERRQSGDYAMSNFEWITVEQEFAVPIVNPTTGEVSDKAYYSGKWDGLLRQKTTGHLYGNEWKTAKAVQQRANLLPNDSQTTFYSIVGKELFGDAFKGMLYTLMAKRVPPPVKVLGSGELSKDIKNQTLASYVAAIKRQHRGITNKEISERYGAQVMALHDAPNPYFERHVVTRNEAALAEGRQELWDVTQEMINPNVALYKTDSFHCGYCMFREPCILKQNGQDFAQNLRDNFQRRKTDVEVMDE